MDTVELTIVLLSAGLHATWSVAIKGSGDAVVFNVLQSLVAFLAALVVLAFVDLSALSLEFWAIFASTSVGHGLYLYGLSRALEGADISLVYPIARSTPALLPLVAVPLLGERISWVGGIGIATVVAGMWLVATGRNVHWRSFFKQGVGFAYLTLAATVVYGVLDKAAMTELDAVDWTSPIPRAVFFFFMTYLGSSVLFVPLGLWRRTDRVLAIGRAEWPKVLLAVLISLASYGLILEAMRTAPASYVVAVRQSSVFFVLALSIVRLGERPGTRRVTGAALTVLGVALIAFAPLAP